MAIRNALLALLAEGPKHGYQLKVEFEAATGDSWPLNIGQVYTTLQRCARDGLLEPAEASGSDARQRRYQLTDAGREVLDAWLAAPVDRDPPQRDELAVKLLVVLAASAADPAVVIQAQRTATLERLQRLNQLARGADPAGDLAWLLVVDHLIFQAEAEVRWLDLCEQRLARAGHEAVAAAARRAAAAGRAGGGGEDAEGAAADGSRDVQSEAGGSR
ncbi:PadR family transcriptional regulator [Egibacter rhizosphaerae]|uniref:PadR family transcriptional regulator n=1 Tax=Egibacter rhizosphaerae TaxID=1670831 RepID=A0A411YEY5_9ACTN|nr:PadR family transcriptional regulator [Egibacter rhizosphaerae]QBI19657.1 PadR family transcriptional regulator [Egibacter rhizosphaerae]